MVSPEVDLKTGNRFTDPLYEGQNLRMFSQDALGMSIWRQFTFRLRLG